MVGDTMYVLTPYPNILYALDLSKPGAPLKWKYEPRPEAAAQGVACCDVVARGPAFADGRIFFNTLDGNFNVKMFPDDAPLTVNNFMHYVNEGAYDSTFFHRLVHDFIVQGGG